jgi:ferredoxin
VQFPEQMVEELKANMRRKIIQIDREKCTGCGLCIDACHEGALQLVDGKAQLVSDVYCDGLGACLPKCPVDAIAIVEREAAAFDEAVVQAAQHRHSSRNGPVPSPPPPAKPACGCPGAMARSLKPAAATAAMTAAAPAASELRQWPCQIKLAPVNAPYFHGADLLVAADCTAFATATVHRDFMAGKITLIGCPKLDSVDYAEKLGAILQANDIRSVTVLRMEVPCCGGLADAVRRALAASGKTIPSRVVILGTDGGVRQKE